MTLSSERIRSWRRAATSIVAVLILYEIVARSYDTATGDFHAASFLSGS